MMRVFIFIMTFILALPFSAQAQSFDAKSFGQLPILDEGRIKPLEAFARAKKKELAGSERHAMHWLMTIMFDPARGENIPALKITNPELLSLLELTKDASKLYNYRTVFAALDKKQDLVLSIVNAKEENWTPAQRELIKLQQRTITLQRLLSSLSALLPLDVDPPRSYLDMVDDVDKIENWVTDIVKLKGQDFEDYTESEQELAELSFLLSSLKQNGQNSNIVRILHQDDKDIWLSPWEAIIQQASLERQLETWKSLVSAYHTADVQAWRTNVQTLHGLYTPARPHALAAEYYYVVYNPFMISFGFCILAIGALLGAHFFTPRLSVLALGFISFSVVSQVIGLGLRIYILERPPVSTLYETVLFVCALVMIYCLFKRKDFWLWVAVGLGFVLHILGFAHAQDGDTLMMLSAVLNTNFWLATHVLTITAAYAFCAITSVLAHYLLIKNHEAVYKNMITCSLIALFLATIGTVLGGIWADQSWGRFWGWDPKENGALLIVLWLIWILHGRICGLMSQDGVLYGLSYLSVILALSWFGVNLLSVGLHSYGFTDSAGIYLGTFIALETAFLIWAYVRRKTSNSLLSS